ncbi:hypothetical protein VTI74DRAFT_10776 [Chaetomium olivicolor]
MAALVQGYPQQSGTVTVLQTRPSSAGGMLQSVPVQSASPFIPGGSQRNSVHGLPATVTAPVVYHGGSAPVQQYAFSNMNPAPHWQQSRTQRTSSSSAVSTIQPSDYVQPAVARSQYSASLSMTNLPSTANTGHRAGAGARDDIYLPVPGTRRSATAPRSPQGSNMIPPQAPPAAATPARAAPERYRRSALRSADSACANSQGTAATAGSQLRPSPSPLLNRPNSFVGVVSGSAVDDTTFAQQQGPGDIRRVRRRSLPALDSPRFPMYLSPHDLKQPAESIRPKSADKDSKTAKTGNSQAADESSSDGQAGSTANPRPSSSANRNGNPTSPSANPTVPAPLPGQAGTKQDSPQKVNIPPRSSSTDVSASKRAANPSPLSKPVTMDAQEGSSQPSDAGVPATVAPAPRFNSPAVKQLTAINEKGGKAKSKTSRLRRAFSFGSTAEFRKAVHDGDGADGAQGKLHKERDPEDAYNEEQERIAQQQEAAGIGSNIYAGGRFFHGSTDNLSISSTASSASIMIRKMGRGMKKGTRSLVGLFRPKSIVGAPVAEVKQPETTQVAVSMITVEAERERVNVNPDPRASGGGTGFPRLERNSIDAARIPTAEPERLGSSGTDSTTARKSIVGGEKERAEVLAAVRKGILKNRTGSSSPSPRPSESKGSGLDLPSVPSVTDSPNSSAPSTPNEDSQRRAGTVAIGSEDYFVSALRLRQDSKSSPSTPQGTKRNATFSPRIVFFETWPSQEYDRRGDIATCNRLTPMLAQQIKEELNTFKMEMEVHENSKIYTHFF